MVDPLPVLMHAEVPYTLVGRDSRIGSILLIAVVAGVALGVEGCCVLNSGRPQQCHKTTVT
jgi:hypothetical protein